MAVPDNKLVVPIVSRLLCYIYIYIYIYIYVHARTRKRRHGRARCGGEARGSSERVRVWRDGEESGRDERMKEKDERGRKRERDGEGRGIRGLTTRACFTR